MDKKKILHHFYFDIFTLFTPFIITTLKMCPYCTGDAKIRYSDTIFKYFKIHNFNEKKVE